MRTIDLKVSHADLMGEVAKWSYTIGENIGDDNSKARHFVQGAIDPGHRDLLKSALDTAWADVVQVLSAYTVDGQCGCGCDYKCGCHDGQGTDPTNELDRFDTDWCADYELRLHFPDNTYPQIVANVPRLVRRYLSLKMRAEWESLINQSNRLSEVEAEQVIRRLKVEVNTRTTVGKTKGRWYYGY